MQFLYNIQYQWKISNKLTLKTEHITFLMTWTILKDLDSNLLKIGKKSYENIDIDYIGCITIKTISNYNSINSVNPLYFIIKEVDGYMDEKILNKHLIFASTDKNKEVLKRFTKLWNEIKSPIDKIVDKPGKYGNVFMKIKFDSEASYANSN